MEAIISSKYFEIIEELFTRKAKDILRGESNGVQSLFRLLNAIPIVTDISNDDIELTKSFAGNKEYSSFKQEIIAAAIKNNTLFSTKKIVSADDIEKFNAYYFLNEPDLEKVSNSMGVVCKGPEYSGKSFYEECTISDLPLMGTWDPIREKVPPVNAILIIDKYLFAKQIRLKVQSLKELIRIYKGPLKIPLHITLVFSTMPKKEIILDENQLEQAFMDILSVGNIELQYVTNDKIPVHDRLIYTNYTSGNIGLPFIKAKTRFNQIFLGGGHSVDEIKKRYREYRRELNEWFKFILNAQMKMGPSRRKFETSGFKNRIFDSII